MKKGKFLLSSLLLAMLLVGCGESKSAKEEKKPEVKQEQVVVKEYKDEPIKLVHKVIKKGEPGKDEVTLTFAATSDMHGRIYPYEYAIDAEDKDAGFAKTNTVVKSLREQNPNLVLIDIGDTVQDNSAELFNHLDTHPMVEAMNDMNYDVWVLGNHEFNFEKDFIKRNIKNFKGSVVNANIKNEEDNSNFVLPYQLFDIEGVKVAVIGIIPPHVPMWEASAPEHFKGLKFEDPAPAVERTIKDLEGQYDVLVGAVHLGRKDEYGATGAFDLAEKFPQFSLILAGHEHAKYVTEVNDTLVLEPGAYGWGVATGDVKVKKEDGKWIVKDVTAKNVETKDVEADKDILNKFKDVHDKSRENANIVIGDVTETFIPKVDYITGEEKVTTMPTSQIEDTAIVQLINDVQKHYAKADISTAAIFTPESNLKAGQFKKKDVAFIYKYTNTLMGVNITGENLLKFMEWSANYYNTVKPGDVTISFNEKVRGYNYDMFDGVNYDINLTKEPGHRIENVTIDGKPLDPNKVYKLAVNNYRFGTLQNLGLIKPEDKYYDSYEALQDNGRVRDLIIDYVQNTLNGKLTPKTDNNWKIVGLDTEIPGREAILEMIKKGEITIPKSASGRTLNVKSINVNDIKK
ncbi:2',3'-cyclic-nucleotide 2'-phosphodiesterase / 3'-nucleotidase [Cetobacterium ceti]|uniref:2',3'-cyclic-nucleotide 2'-phosphodiesterase / 3'-nucleotidase n=1 Tax=Cetobacterium ceti TaxID=180163 RepID=A0A1T4PLX7_9FUSO|nr:5'-nucleotidase C-terminal domain-containing protein [Cetobacterium ceti]SJZ92594.1 2',3'-cyclic-nucleotide 2'-phosphodiesterase / 3'-nucleotidase [Cetobacterium ceti]